MVAVTFFLRDVTFAGTGFRLGALVLPSILGMNVSLGMISMSQQLTADREDGTLLRAKAIPHGMVGYLTGRIISVGGGLVADLAVFLVPALLIVPGLAVGDLNAWLTLAWVVVLGMIATLPIGAVLGSLFTSTRAQALLTMPMLGLIGISGIFYPIASLPEWLQWIAQLFPVYWLGLGTRSALLPESAVAVELDDSWRHWETVAVLGGWAAIGLVLAPLVLRRMARRESGAGLAARRDNPLQRIG